MKKWQANLGLLFVAFFWGGSFIAAELLLDYFTPINMQTYRNLFASLILIIIFFKKFINVSFRTVLIGSLLGGLFLLGNTIQTIGLQYTTVSKNAFLTANYVIIVPILSIFILKVLPSKYLIIGVLLMLVGYFLILFNINVLDISSYQNVQNQILLNKGDIYTLIAAFAFALQIVAVSYFIKDEDPIQVLIFQSLFATIIGIIFTLATKQSFQTEQLANINKVFLPLFYLIVFSSILCFGGQLIFQKYTDSSSAGILMSLESAFAATFAVLLGLDNFYSGLLVGGILVIIGIITAETNLNFIRKK